MLVSIGRHLPGSGIKDRASILRFLGGLTTLLSQLRTGVNSAVTTAALLAVAKMEQQWRPREIFGVAGRTSASTNRRRIISVSFMRKHRPENSVYQHQYYVHHKERLRARKHEYYQKNRDKERARRRRYYDMHRAQETEQRRCYYWENRDKVLERKRRSYYEQQENAGRARRYIAGQRWTIKTEAGRCRTSAQRCLLVSGCIYRSEVVSANSQEGLLLNNSSASQTSPVSRLRYDL